MATHTEPKNKNEEHSLTHHSLINELTLEEKASLLSGANFWNTKAIKRLAIPSIMLTDGPHGLRKQGGKSDHLGLNASIPATCFPTAATLASSWDVSLLETVGATIGAEAASQKVSVLLGPGLNIVRNPLGGRTFEYFSEDPYLAGKLAARLTRGIQSNGIAASAKHFAVNSQEHLRMSMDEIVDERTLREIYLEGFRYVVKEAKPRTIMTSYNKVNGTYSNENTHLLHDILKKEWAYDGIIVTDWGGENDRVAGLKAGNQLEMPSTNGITDKEVVAAVKQGMLDESIVNDRVNDLLELTLTTHKALESPPTVNLEKHHEAAVDAARRSMVLLKNDEATLPLSPKARIAVIGDFATTPRYQGAGSSLINPTRIDDAYQYLVASGLTIIGFEPGFKRFGGKSNRLQNKAMQLAEQADTVVLFLGLNEISEAEGIDRKHMRLPENQYALVNELIKRNGKVVVVLAGGGPVELPFANDVSAILHSQLGGQGGGQAVCDLLTGKVAPSGKLAVTYPLSYSDVPLGDAFPGQERTSEHREGLYVGYRYYNTINTPVRYPFGHGLSYTTFSYKDIKSSQKSTSLTVTNTGGVAAEEIVQVYVHPVTKITFRPEHELKGFTKVRLEPGESKTVSIDFDEHSFAYYDTSKERWVTATGEYEVWIGSSSRDIRLKEVIAITGETAVDPYNSTALSLYYSGHVESVDSKTFETLLNRPLPPAKWDRTVPLTLEDTPLQLQYANLFGRTVYRSLLFFQKVLYLFNKPLTANNIAFIINMPLYKFERFSGGAVSRKKLERFLKLVN